MKEYIERSTLLAIIFAKFNEHYGKSRAQAIHDFYRFVTKKICVAPAADVVEVVRCKDCKYSGMYCFGTSKEETLACLEIEEDGFIRFATATNADGYCSYGERKEE